MRFSNVILTVLLVLVWSLIALWQYDLQNLGDEVKKNIPRYDLFILPIAILISIYVLRRMIRNGKHK